MFFSFPVLRYSINGFSGRVLYKPTHEVKPPTTSIYMFQEQNAYTSTET